MNRALPLLAFLALAPACEDPPPGGWGEPGAYVDPGLVRAYPGVAEDAGALQLEDAGTDADADGGSP